MRECLTHAQIANRTHYHFGQRLFLLNKEFVEARVNNVFVKGYYYSVVNGEKSSTLTFERYIGNYLEPKAPLAFFRSVLTEIMPKGVVVQNIQDIQTKPIPVEQTKALAEQMEKVVNPRKAEYRSAEDIKQLAEIDSILFLTVSQMAGDVESDDTILNGNAYLITSANRYRISAKVIGLPDNVTSRPSMLIALLEMVGSIEIPPTEFIGLFENSLLIAAVEQSWADVEKLLDSGINLAESNIARLLWDLDNGLHEKIVAEEAELAGQEDFEGSEMAGSALVDLVNSATKRGYKPIPEMDALMKELAKEKTSSKEKDVAYQEILKKYSELEKKVAYLARRREKYVNRISRGKSK